MASSSLTRRLLNNSSLSALKSAISKHNPRISPPLNVCASDSTGRSSAVFTFRRFHCALRNPVSELGGVQSLMPLHSTVATARMISCLALDSSNCRALSQGTLCRTYPGP